MVSGLAFGDYAWAGGREALLRLGPERGPILIAAPPLFEEANRTRALILGVVRNLAARGVVGIVPDLPGQGESLTLTRNADLAMARAAFAAAAATLGSNGSVFAWSIRSGALVEDDAPVVARWRLSPVLAGRDVLRELARIHQAATNARAVADLAGARAPVEIAGNLIAPAMLRQLAQTSARQPARTVRLVDDRREADLRLPGTPPWRQSEPSADPVLVRRIADDIARWIVSCAG